MTTAQEIVQKLNDNQAVMMLNKVHNRLFTSLDFDILENNVKDKDIGKTLLAIDDEQLDVELDAVVSVRLSREFLESLARDDQLSVFITDAWEEVQNDDSMFIGTVIAIGLMVNLTLFMVSSKIDINIGGVTISKDTVDTEAVKAIMEPITEAIKIL